MCQFPNWLVSEFLLTRQSKKPQKSVVYILLSLFCHSKIVALAGTTEVCRCDFLARRHMQRHFAANVVTMLVTLRYLVVV